MGDVIQESAINQTIQGVVMSQTESEKRTPALKIKNGVTPVSLTFLYGKGDQSQVAKVNYVYVDKEGNQESKTALVSQSSFHGLPKTERDGLNAFLHRLDVSFDQFVPERGA